MKSAVFPSQKNRQKENNQQTRVTKYQRYCCSGQNKAFFSQYCKLKFDFG